jgi:uncharacterized protein (TIGR00255 family)
MEKKFLDKGFVVLAWGDAGWVRFFSKEAAVRPDDYKRMKFFAWGSEPDQQAIMKSLGYTPVALETGDALAAIQTGMIDRIEALVAAAGTEAAAHPAIIRDRFAGRMSELLGQAASEERNVQEAAALATRADVREELDRLAGHIAAARTLIASEAAAGRRLDFLTQEFMREANTLCSKSATPALTAIGLDLKAVIEQFREQVQNVE